MCNSVIISRLKELEMHKDEYGDYWIEAEDVQEIIDEFEDKQ